LHDHFDEEFDKRFVGSKGAIDRVPLDCLGPWHQLHLDGHEKLGAQALEMGGLGLPIYAAKDQFSSFLLIMRVLPNVRLGNTIGHFYLDWVEEYGCKFHIHGASQNLIASVGTALQLTTDKGSEIWEMVKMHETLR
jgi:hypothetical protein